MASRMNQVMRGGGEERKKRESKERRPRQRTKKEPKEPRQQREPWLKGQGYTGVRNWGKGSL